MTEYILDIIVPVWNEPVEVRAALASFVSGSPMARLIMVNNGSERETEAILDEFAEALDARALLVASPKNIGRVAAVNLGIARSTAPFVLVANPFTRLKDNWFDSVQALFENHSDAGTILLKNGGKTPLTGCIEADHGSFDAMVLRKSLCEAAGEFDGNMDGGEWVLRDYARRSLLYGYTTFSHHCRQLNILQYREFGSTVRRQEREALARQTYEKRWGEMKTFLLVCSEQLFGADSGILLDAVLQSARQGDKLIVAAENRVAKSLLVEGIAVLHENINFLTLPRFFPDRALRRVVEGALAAEPATILISEGANLSVDLKKITFADFQATLQQRNECCYQKGRR